MKVKLQRDHLDHKKGETVDVTPERAKYWELVGVAKKAGKSDDSESEESDKTPAKKETASKAAPAKKTASKSSKK